MTLTPSTKLIPYTINAPFWSDKAIKSRWLAVPTPGAIGFSPTGEWTFPAGTIAVKHFEYGIDDANPAIKKRLETRVLLQMTSGGVYGATYKWRSDNSDADLINDAITENMTIATPGIGTLTGQDIGSPLAGSTSRIGEAVTISASGGDIWGISDQFHFAWQQRTGDFDIPIKITSLEQADLYSKIGLMVRESLSADSRHLYAMAFPSNAARNNNVGGYEFQYRAITGGGSAAIYPATPQPRVAYPNTWLRLRRVGNTFTAYSSDNGASWNEFARLTQAMPATAYFGIAATSHNAALTTTATVETQTSRQQQWYYPSRTDCASCHNNNAGGFLGPKTRQLNKDHVYVDTGVTDNELRAWNHIGLFNPPLNEASIPTYDKLAHVDQVSESLEKRARSYLDSNCASCHRPGGVPALWDARYDTPLTNQGIIYGIVNNTLGLTSPRVVVPQDTSRSAMHYRMNRVGANQMPPLARNLVDDVGVQLIADWINSLATNTAPVVALTSPSNGANFIIPNPILLTATASDTDGITKVEFYDGTTKVGESAAAPYTFSLSNPTLGTHTLFARAFDGVNNSTDSAGITVTVTELLGLVKAKVNFQLAAAAVPVSYVADSGLAYAARGNGLTYGWSRDNTTDSRDRNAHADQRYDTLVHMQKDHGGGDVTSSWSIALPNGKYSVHVVAGDAQNTDGTQAVSANGVVLTTGIPAAQNFYEGTATIVVTNGLLTFAPGADGVNAKLCYLDISEIAPANNNQLPLVIVSGTSPDFASAGGSIKILAATSDPDGSIARVEFYADGIKFGEDFTAPYSYVWNGLLAGSYSVTARAIDNSGSGAMSDPVKVFVFNPNQTGLFTQHFDNADHTNLKVTRLEATVDHEYGENESPDASVAGTDFSSRWRGRVLSRTAGDYTFKVIGDDGVRLWVNGVQLVNAWVGQAPTPYTGLISLQANTAYDIKLEHYQGGGPATVRLLWSGPGFVEEVIPAGNLLTPATGVPSANLSGIIIGTVGSWGDNPNSTKAAVFDGNLNTFFDSPNGAGDWAGLDLGGTGRQIIGVRFAPRDGFAYRMTGGVFQGANNADFSDAVTLFTIVAAPAYGVLTDQLIANNTAFRYVRYLSPNDGFCNVAEVEFQGTTIAPSLPGGLVATAGHMQVALGWSPASAAANYNIKRSTASGGPFTAISNTPAVFYTDTTAFNGMTYYYVVTAVNDSGESANSNEASGTPASPPIMLTEQAAPGISLSGSDVVLGVNTTIVGHTYQIQYSDTLLSNDWHDMGAPFIGNGSGMTFQIVNEATLPRRFYRIWIQR